MLDTVDCRLEVEKVLLPMEEEYRAGGGSVFIMLRSTACKDSVVAWGSGRGSFERKLKSAAWLEAVIGGDSGSETMKSACLVGVLGVFGTAPLLFQPIIEGMICVKHQAVLGDK